MAAGRLHDDLVGRFGVTSVLQEGHSTGNDWIEEIQNALARNVFQALLVLNGQTRAMLTAAAASMVPQSLDISKGFHRD